MTTRRAFIGGALATAGSVAYASGEMIPQHAGEIRAMLLHFGSHLWGPESKRDVEVVLDYPTWDKITASMVAKRQNMVVVDVGEAVVWPSHPEIAIKGSWEASKFKDEMRRLQKLGLEPIPKLNFSTTHNYWLGEYRKMCTHSRYYEVCNDIVKDCAELFDHPRFLHIGFDEESYEAQEGDDLSIVRHGDLWYHDLFEHVRSVENAGMCAWMWSDYGWKHKDFVKRCPKSVIQSNWYYDEHIQGFDPSKADEEFSARLNLFLALDKAGFKQIPCGSNWKSRLQKEARWKVNRSMVDLVKFCRSNISRELLAGFMMAPWKLTTAEGLDTNLEGVSILEEALSACQG